MSEKVKNKDSKYETLNMQFSFDFGSSIYSFTYQFIRTPARHDELEVEMKFKLCLVYYHFLGLPEHLFLLTLSGVLLHMSPLVKSIQLFCVMLQEYASVITKVQVSFVCGVRSQESGSILFLELSINSI